uniref:Uncharacterized protein n=1 Tax=Ignisphaera aggregans TaxID=334771 RepID=A0A7C5UV27_9CREN
MRRQPGLSLDLKIYGFRSGNPRTLSLLYQVEWNIDIAVDNLAKMKGIRKFIALLSNEKKE